MTLTLSPRAIREAERCARWWYEHRPAARTLFDEELRRALDQIRNAPGMGSNFKAKKSGREYRRVLMPETRCHVYYRELPRGFRRREARAWADRIPSRRSRTIVLRALGEVTARA